jgi:predicted HTH domain antitoxin
MQLVLNIPDEVVYGSNENAQSLVEMAKRKIALELFKYAKISPSQAAQAASMRSADIYELMKLASKENIECLDTRFLDDELEYASKVAKIDYWR